MRANQIAYAPTSIQSAGGNVVDAKIILLYNNCYCKTIALSWFVLDVCLEIWYTLGDELLLNLKESTVRDADLSSLSDDALAGVEARLLALVPELTHPESLSYEQAANRLGVKYERVAGLVSQGILLPGKLPRDARKWLSSDQIAWYQLKQSSRDEGLPNPAMLREELARRQVRQIDSRPRDTLADVRAYVTERMGNSPTADHLNTALEETAKHLAGALARDAAGAEQLDDAERVRLTALLALLTGRGDTRKQGMAASGTRLETPIA
jgi:hypothetical protein